MNITWAEVSCDVPSAMVDQLADFLVELSGTGVSIENLSLDTFSLDTLEETPIKTVKAYFAADTPLNGKVAELCNQYLTKGRLVCVEGSLHTRSWEKPPGEKHYTTEIVGSRITFLDSNKNGENKGPAVAEEESGDPF